MAKSKTVEYVTEAIASRLLGTDIAMISRRAAAGDYGACVRTKNGRLYIPMKGLMRKARRVLLYDPRDHPANKEI